MCHTGRQPRGGGSAAACCLRARGLLLAQGMLYKGDPFMVQHHSTSWMKYDLYSYDFTFRSHNNHVCVPFRQVYSNVDTYSRASHEFPHLTF